MKIYCVSIVWIKQIETGLNVSNTLQADIEANSKEEAVGIAYKINKHIYPNHSVHSQVALEQCK